MKMMMALLLALSSLNAGEIRIAVAANVSYAIKSLKQEFKILHPEIKVQVILGSSGKLTVQIRHGAPYDLFLSANIKYPDALYEDNFAVSQAVIYAQGALALLSLKERKYKGDMSVLKSPDIQKIAIANPKTAPYGIATVEALKNAKVYQKVKDKLVYGESISQTITYATTAADIGIIAKSSLFSPQMSEFKYWAEVDENLYTPINQGMVILKSAEANVEVKTFYDFILSPKAQEILKSFGYKVL